MKKARRAGSVRITVRNLVWRASAIRVISLRSRLPAPTVRMTLAWSQCRDDGSVGLSQCRFERLAHNLRSSYMHLSRGFVHSTEEDVAKLHVLVQSKVLDFPGFEANILVSHALFDDLHRYCVSPFVMHLLLM